MTMSTNKMNGFLLLLALAALPACNADEDQFPVASRQTRTVVSENVPAISHNPVYAIGEKNSNGVYNAMPLTATETEGLTLLNVTVRLPKAVTLTGISFTAPVGKAIGGGDTHMVFAEFRNAAGENYV